MKTIKTKAHVEGIKVFDKAADVTKRAKNAYSRTKEAAGGTKQSQHSTPSEYAIDSTENTAQAAVGDVADHAVKAPKRVYDSAVHAKKRFQETRNKQHLEGRQSKNTAPGRVAPRTDYTVNNTSSTRNETIKTEALKTGSGLDTTSKGIRTTAKQQVKATLRTVKTTALTGKKTIKTAQQTAKAAQKSTQAAARAARVASQATRIAVKKAILLGNAAVKVTIATVKAIIVALKALVSAIAAGGWVAVVIVLVVCLIAILIGSVFGIFFSGEAKPETGQTINSVIAEIDKGFTEQIDLIISTNPHVLLDVSGTRALWKHVLAIYTVRTVTDPDKPMEVAVMTDEKAQILRDVFWDMNIITYETIRYDVEMDELDDDGVPIGETFVETTTVLYIRVEGKTVSEISAQYGFTAEQSYWLEELLKPEYISLWNALLYGITSIGDGTLIEIAETQIGNIGGEPYWRWYGFSSRVPWCACFVSWCAEQAGYIEAGIIPRFSSCTSGIQWFKNRGRWQGLGYTPSPGDLIFFDWDADGRANHVGIVERVEGGYVYTIEGNSSDSVRRRSYLLGSNRIFGYGMPSY